MKIALIGYGKMGKTIEQLAIKQGHEIALIIDKNNQKEFTAENLQKADVAIEFTQPMSAFENILTCFQAGIPVVSGTTGWDKHMANARNMCADNEGTLLHSSNFSIGVNLFFAINKQLAKLMDQHAQYGVLIEETHHLEKKDAPSGTAITLANDILSAVNRKTEWINDVPEDEEQLSIVSKRVDSVPGTHQVSYASKIDTIDIKHTAHSRDGFALGAILAAEFIQNRKGCFDMSDVLGL